MDGEVFEEESEVTNQVVQFYKNLYKECEGWRLFVEGLEFDRIGDMERGFGLKGSLRERRYFKL